MNPWVIAAMAAMGAMKGARERENQRHMAKAEAEATKFSPWTGMKGRTVQMTDPFGSMMQGAVAGASMGDFGDDKGDKKDIAEEPEIEASDDNKLALLEEQNTMTGPSGKRNRTFMDKTSIA